MTHTDFDQGTATLVRAADAEVIGFSPANDPAAGRSPIWQQRNRCG